MFFGSVSSLDWFLVGGLLLCGIVVAIATAVFVTDFRRELRYINMEIGRSNGEEREYWMKRRRRLWLSLLPFIR